MVSVRSACLIIATILVVFYTSPVYSGRKASPVEVIRIIRPGDINQEKLASERIKKVSVSLYKEDDNIRFSSERFKKFINDGTAEDVLNYIKAHHIDINQYFPSPINGRPFSRMVINNFKEARKLYDYGIVDVKKTKIHYSILALRKENYKIRYLLERGFHSQGFTEDGKQGKPPYISVASMGNLEACKLLIKYGADSTVSYGGRDALGWSISTVHFNEELFDHLLSQGLKVKEEYVFRCIKNESILKRILDKNPEFLNLRKDGKDLIDIAISKRCKKGIFEILVNRGLKLTCDHLKASIARKTYYERPGRIGGVVILHDPHAEDVAAYIKSELRS